ncbi:hypothetical protein [Chitinilyticum piscinae]|uniref:Uncharacterized protein n=1 Tax=Chitinilyticum piscinae TaxID=2866724 RepID=A0A8J7FP27_9NEIS|nr:hypothetical protein [Chitinilyticum piscinae]MBE9610411.1 hypothetical protein [Chitinilyticum piscinae]
MRDYRKQLLNKLLALDEIDSEHLPVVTLDEYFTGNEQEESIAPNQWAFGRPSIRELYAHFSQIQARDDVQCVLVGLHQDWGMALENDTDWPAAENIHIISTAPSHIAEQWAEGLESDGIGVGWPYGKHSAAPDPQNGAQVYTVFWD